MPTGDRLIRIDDVESIVEHVLPDWLRRVWRASSWDADVLAAVEDAFRGLFENAYALLEDLPRIAEWEDYESYAIMKGHFVAGIVDSWRTIIRLGELLPAFGDSHVLLCPHCGRVL